MPLKMRIQRRVYAGLVRAHVDRHLVLLDGAALTETIVRWAHLVERLVALAVVVLALEQRDRERAAAVGVGEQQEALGRHALGRAGSRARVDLRGRLADPVALAAFPLRDPCVHLALLRSVVPTLTAITGLGERASASFYPHGRSGRLGPDRNCRPSDRARAVRVLAGLLRRGGHQVEAQLAVGGCAELDPRAEGAVAVLLLLHAAYRAGPRERATGYPRVGDRLAVEGGGAPHVREPGRQSVAERAKRDRAVVPVRRGDREADAGARAHGLAIRRLGQRENAGWDCHRHRRGTRAVAEVGD